MMYSEVVGAASGYKERKAGPSYLFTPTRLEKGLKQVQRREKWKGLCFIAIRVAMSDVGNESQG